MKKIVLTALCVLIFPLTLYAARAVYVQSVKAKIMSEPTFKSRELGAAQRGDKLPVLEEGTGWVKVSFKDASGWVNKLTVSSDPPMEKINIITADAASLEEKARKRASAMTSAAAARGLSDQERKRLSDMGSADYRALMRLERETSGITDAEINEFGSSGK